LNLIAGESDGHGNSMSVTDGRTDSAAFMPLS